MVAVHQIWLKKHPNLLWIPTKMIHIKAARLSTECHVLRFLFYFEVSPCLLIVLDHFPFLLCVTCVSLSVQPFIVLTCVPLFLGSCWFSAFVCSTESTSALFLFVCLFFCPWSTRFCGFCVLPLPCYLCFKLKLIFWVSCKNKQTKQMCIWVLHSSSSFPS